MGLEQLLEVIDPGCQRIDVALGGSDPEHMQDDLRVLGIVLVPAVVQGLPGAGERHGRDQPLLEAGQEQAIGQPTAVVTCGVEADHDRTGVGSQDLNEAVMIRLSAQNGEPPASDLSGGLDEHLVAVLGDIDCYRGGRSGCRIALGHGWPPACVQQHHCETCRPAMTTPGSAAAQPGPASSRCFPMCYGPEMVARALREWLARLGTKTLYIEPGSPWENGYCESFNGKLKDECLKFEIFYSLKEAQVIIGAWKDHYNRGRPHSSLGYRPLAPVTLVAIEQQLPISASMQ